MPLESYDISAEDAAFLLNALKEGRERIANPDNWCTGAYAKTADGATVGVGDTRAKRHCMLGSVDQALCYPKAPLPRSFSSVPTLGDEARMILFLANEDSVYGSVTDVNDHGGHAKALELMDKAIEDFDWLLMRLA